MYHYLTKNYHNQINLYVKNKLTSGLCQKHLLYTIKYETLVNYSVAINQLTKVTNMKVAMILGLVLLSIVASKSKTDIVVDVSDRFDNINCNSKT